MEIDSNGEMAMEEENEFEMIGLVDRDDCEIVEAVVKFLEGGATAQSFDARPEKVVTSHFVNPLRSLAAVRRLLERKSGCDIFKTPDRPNAEWSVLEGSDPEVQTVKARLEHDDPCGENQRWDYVLSQPSRDDVQWRHAFSLVENFGGADVVGDSPVHETDFCVRTCYVSASKGWLPHKSGLLFSLRDVAMGDDVCERVDRRDLLRGLASHLVGKTMRSLKFADREEDGFATVQKSPTGVLYIIYTTDMFGPTHIFSCKER